ncbi:unnamed protein product [Bubo scandiacus]
MPVAVGQPMPGAVPSMPHGACSGCSSCAGTYSAAADPMLTYFRRAHKCCELCMGCAGFEKLHGVFKKGSIKYCRYFYNVVNRE